MKRLILTAALGVALLAQNSPATAATVRYDNAIIDSLVAQAPGLRPEVLRLAMEATENAANRGELARPELLTVIDYSLSSSVPRLFTFDLASHKLLYRELVAHGKNSGGDFATRFSNDEGSLQTSIGLFVTADTYVGGNGYSLRLRGLDRGYNDRAMSRYIVMHGAPYVSTTAVKSLGRLGRSWGCPAVRSDIARELIDRIRGGSAIFSYYPDEAWLSASAFLSRPAAGGRVATAAR